MTAYRLNAPVELAGRYGDGDGIPTVWRWRPYAAVNEPATTC